jgi:diguanylate cyclase (GGDEF)-like protein
MSDVISTSGAPHGDGLFSLTQIRHLMRIEFGRAQRYTYPITCMIVEVDRLGYLRDLYGYDLKEAVLEDVIGILRAHTRSCDYLGRQVDDRLMAVMPHTDRAGGACAAQRLVEEVRGLHFEVDGRTLQVTVTIGIACFEDNNTLFFDQLVECAEAAASQASAAGGDRYRAHDVGKVEL